MPTLIIIPKDAGSSVPTVINTGSTGISLSVDLFTPGSDDFSLPEKQGQLSDFQDIELRGGLTPMTVQIPNTPNFENQQAIGDVQLSIIPMTSSDTPDLGTNLSVPTTITEVVL